jgi:hypothetical protein
VGFLENDRFAEANPIGELTLATTPTGLTKHGQGDLRGGQFGQGERLPQAPPLPIHRVDPAGLSAITTLPAARRVEWSLWSPATIAPVQPGAVGTPSGRRVYLKPNASGYDHDDL